VRRARGMAASEDSYRLYSCRRCARQVRICRCCDRGHQYCVGDCARIRRCESLRRAGQRYQQSYRGACRHAARQRTWRARQTKKVTHQGSLSAIVPHIVVAIAITTEGTDAENAVTTPRPDDDRLAPRCCCCGRSLGRFVRLGPLCGGP